MLDICEPWHHHTMHPGVRKQAIDMQRRCEIDEIGLYNVIKQVKKGCSFCQACNPDNRYVPREAKLTPIPDQPMQSVAMDVFSMPEKKFPIVWSCVWTDTAATLWPSRRAKRGC